MQEPDSNDRCRGEAAHLVVAHPEHVRGVAQAGAHLHKVQVPPVPAHLEVCTERQGTSVLHLGSERVVIMDSLQQNASFQKA